MSAENDLDRLRGAGGAGLLDGEAARDDAMEAPTMASARLLNVMPKWTSEEVEFGLERLILCVYLTGICGRARLVLVCF